MYYVIYRSIVCDMWTYVLRMYGLGLSTRPKRLRHDCDTRRVIVRRGVSYIGMWDDSGGRNYNYAT